MNDIPLFDSLTHPTLDDQWTVFGSSRENRMRDLLEQMSRNSVQRALAVGMEGIGGYDEAAYSRFILARSAALYPVAFYGDFEHTDHASIQAHLLRMKENRYIGIKIHPRLSGIDYACPALQTIIQAANELELAVLLCTYSYGRDRYRSVEQLFELLFGIRDCKVVLLHGGAVRLLETMEMARAFPNVLLDLSLTLCKYEGSSIDSDIRHLFQKFDRRICVGSDYPDFAPESLRRRFNEFASSIERAKAERIAFRNLYDYIGAKRYDDANR